MRCADNGLRKIRSPEAQVAKLKGENRFGASSRRCEKNFASQWKREGYLHPWRLTWNIIMEVWKIIFLSKWVICRFHVNLPGCTFLGKRSAVTTPACSYLKFPFPKYPDRPNSRSGVLNSRSATSWSRQKFFPQQRQERTKINLRSIKSKMLGQNQEWKQNSSCSLFHCISFLHVVHVEMGSVPTLAKTFQGGGIRRNLLLHRMACSRKEIQMAIQYRIVPSAGTADMNSAHVVFNPCEPRKKPSYFPLYWLP